MKKANEKYKKIINNRYVFFIVNFLLFYIIEVVLYRNFIFLGVGKLSWTEIFNKTPLLVFGAVLYAFGRLIQNWGRFNKNENK